MASRREIEEKVKKAINKNYTKIIYKVDPGPVIRKLKESGLLTVAGHDGYYEELCKLLENKTKSTVMERLIDILFHRENWWLPFIKALRENNNYEAADIITSALPNSEKMKLIERPKSKETRRTRTRRQQENYSQSEDTDSDYPDFQNGNLRARSIRPWGHPRNIPSEYSSDANSMDSEVEPARTRFTPSSLINGPSRMQTRSKQSHAGTRQNSLPTSYRGNPAYQSYDNDFASYVSQNQSKILPVGYSQPPLRHHSEEHDGILEMDPRQRFQENQIPEIQNPNRSSIGFQPAQGPQVRNGQETSLGYSFDLGQPRATRQPSTSTLKYQMTCNADTRTGPADGSAIGQATGNMPESGVSSGGHLPGASTLPERTSSREEEMQKTSRNYNDLPQANPSLHSPSPSAILSSTDIQTSVDQKSSGDIDTKRTTLNKNDFTHTPSPVPNSMSSSNLSPADVKTSVGEQQSSGDSGTKGTSKQTDPLHSQTSAPPPPAPAPPPAPPGLQASADDQDVLLTVDTPVYKLPGVIITHLEKMNYDECWRNFLRELSNKITFEDETRIASNNNCKVLQIIQLFLEREGSKATFGKIMTALRKIKRRDVMDGIKKSTGFGMDEESDSDIGTSSVSNPAYLNFSFPSLAPNRASASEESNKIRHVYDSGPARPVTLDDCLEEAKATPLKPKDCDKEPQACSLDFTDCPQTVSEASAISSPNFRKSYSLENDQGPSFNSDSQLNEKPNQKSEKEFTKTAEKSSVGRRITSTQRQKENQIDKNNKTPSHRPGYADTREAETGSPESNTSDSNNLHVSEDETTQLDDTEMANRNIKDTDTSQKIINIGESATVSEESDTSVSMGSYIPLGREKVAPQVTQKSEPVRMQQPVTQGLIPLYQIQPQLQTPQSFPYGYPAMPLQPVSAQMMGYGGQYYQLQGVQHPSTQAPAPAINSVSSYMLFLPPSNPQINNTVYWPPNPSQTNVPSNPGNKQPSNQHPKTSVLNPDLRETSNGSLILDSVNLPHSVDDDVRRILAQSNGNASCDLSFPPQIHEDFAEAVLRDIITKAESRHKSEGEDLQESDEDEEGEDNEENGTEDEENGEEDEEEVHEDGDEDENEDDDEDDDDEDGVNDEPDGDMMIRKREDGFEHQTFPKCVEEQEEEETFLKQPFQGSVSALTSVGTPADETKCQDVRREEQVCEEVPKLSKIEHAKASQVSEVEQSGVSQEASITLGVDQLSSPRQVASYRDAEQSPRDAEDPQPAVYSGSSSGLRTVIKSAVKLYEYYSLGTGDNPLQRWHSN